MNLPFEKLWEQASHDPRALAKLVILECMYAVQNHNPNEFIYTTHDKMIADGVQLKLAKQVENLL